MVRTAARIQARSPMNARLVPSNRRATHSGSISYDRIIAPYGRAQAAANRPPAAPPRFKSLCHNRQAQNAPVNPLDSALAKRCHSQVLKVLQNPHLRKNRGWVGILLTTFPKRNSANARTQGRSSLSGFIVTSLLHCFVASLFSRLADSGSAGR